MIEIQEVDARELKDPRSLGDLLRRRTPFFSRGSGLRGQPFDTMVDLFRKKKTTLWDQQNDFFNTFRHTLEDWNDEACPCTVMSGTDTVESTELRTDQDFQVVVRYVFPNSDIDKALVQPIMQGDLAPFREHVRSINLFNTVFVSRGEARGILHAHNYDVLGNVVEAGAGTKIYMYPTDRYEAFGSKCMPARSGVINFHNDVLEDDVIEEAHVHALEAGDLIHIPFGWYHRVDHQGTYVHVATNWFLNDLLEQRLAAVRPTIPRHEWDLFESHTRRLRHFQFLAPIDAVADVVTAKVPIIKELSSKLKAALRS